VVKETNDGQKFYDYDTSEELSPAVSGAKPTLPKEGGPEPVARLKISMAELMSYVNAEHGGQESASAPLQQRGKAYQLGFLSASICALTSIVWRSEMAASVRTSVLRTSDSALAATFADSFRGSNSASLDASSSPPKYQQFRYL
jgi:hypothetical protein